MLRLFVRIFVKSFLTEQPFKNHSCVSNFEINSKLNRYLFCFCEYKKVNGHPIFNIIKRADLCIYLTYPQKLQNHFFRYSLVEVYIFIM